MVANPGNSETLHENISIKHHQRLRDNYANHISESKFAIFVILRRHIHSGNTGTVGGEFKPAGTKNSAGGCYDPDL